MSSTIEAFVVDLDRLRNFYGSNDSQLMSEILQHFERPIQALEGDAAGLVAKGAPTVKQALDEFVAGNITRPQFAEMYRHAFNFLVRHLGKALPSGRFESAKWGYIEDLEWIEPILKNGCPLPVPQSLQSSETIGHLTAAQAQELFDALQDTDFSDLEPDIASGREQILEWYEEAARRNWGIVVIVS